MQQMNFCITKVLIHNRNTGWFVAETNDGQTITGASIIPPYGNISVMAEERTYKGTKQWSCKSALYSDLDSITQSLLSTGLVEGISGGKAPAVFEMFGKDIWLILNAACDGVELIEFMGRQRNPLDLLQDVSGIGPAVARQMIKSWETERHVLTSAINAIRCGLTVRQFREIIGDDGENRIAFDMMVHNVKPYSIYDLVSFGIPFDKVDRLAMEDWPDKVALLWDAPERFAGAVKVALKEASEEGHMCSPVLAVEARVQEIVGAGNVMSTFDNLEEVGLAVFNGMVYSRASYMEETSISQHLARIRGCPYNAIEMTSAEIQSFADDGVELHEDQIKAIQLILRSKISIITGGPGVGKTTILKVAVAILNDRSVGLKLCAFMGAAARRMAIATGHPSETLHTSLQLFKSKEDRLTIKNGYLIIDEMSTISSSLFAMVMAQVYNDVHLVFVGDADQLPPVGNGEVFVQLLESDLPRVRLTKLFRNGGAIAQACRDVNMGIMPTPDNKNFFLLNKKITDTDIPVRMIKAEEYLAKEGCEGAQILTPLNATRQNANKLMQEKRNPHGAKIPFTSIRVGDRVVHLKNNREIGVRNGMVGICHSMTDEARVILGNNKEADNEFQGDLMGKGDAGHDILSVMFDEETFPRSYKAADLRQLDLGYAITVHKSQGNQFDYVIVVIPNLLNTPGLSLRQIPYTAMSRAKKKLIVIAYPGALEACVGNEIKLRRYSNLAAFLNEWRSNE